MTVAPSKVVDKVLVGKDVIVRVGGCKLPAFPAGEVLVTVTVT